MWASAGLITVVVAFASAFTVHREKRTSVFFGKPAVKVKMTQDFVTAITPMLSSAMDLYFTEEFGKCIKGQGKSLSSAGSEQNVWIADEVEVTEHEMPDMTITLQEPSNFDITLRGGHIAFTIKGHKKSNPDQKGEGTVDISNINDHIVLAWKLVDGAIKMELDTCDVSRTIDTSFTSDPLDEEAQAFYNYMKDNVNDVVCQGIRDMLLKLRQSRYRGGHGSIVSDYSFTRLPRVSNNAMELFMLGCYRGVNATNADCMNLANFNPADFPEELDDSTHEFYWMEADEKKNQLMRLALEMGLLNQPYKLPQAMGGDLFKEIALSLMTSYPSMDVLETDEYEVYGQFDSAPSLQYVANSEKTEMNVEMDPILTFVIKRDGVETSRDKFKVHLSGHQTIWLELNDDGTPALNDKGKPIVHTEGSFDADSFAIEQLEGNFNEEQIHAIKEQMLATLNEKLSVISDNYEVVMKDLMPMASKKRMWLFRLMQALGSKDLHSHTYDNVVVRAANTGEVNVEEGAHLLVDAWVHKFCSKHSHHHHGHHGVDDGHAGHHHHGHDHAHEGHGHGDDDEHAGHDHHRKRRRDEDHSHTGGCKHDH